MLYTRSVLVYFTSSHFHLIVRSYAVWSSRTEVSWVGVSEEHTEALI